MNHPKNSHIQSLQELSLGKTEQDVREDFIKPLLNLLGYQSETKNNIEREVALKIPFVKSGTKKISIYTFPDYVLSINGHRKWVLDAKNTSESVLVIEHISQVHSYAIHKEINVSFYVLCNGNEIAIYRTIDTEYEPISYFRRSELLEYWEELYQILSVESFAERLNFEVSNSSIKTNSEYFSNKSQNKENLIDKEPLRKAIIPREQASKVHARTHPYFTRRFWNVIQEYIRYYSNPGDTILDCFGGSGVTLIEALVLSRKGIYFDINPIAYFK
ncbi:DNA methyltransferase [Nostoc sp.]|uniref:DNA methyltransferase n=1 Tax=Nostoc sp. TaxID=1180 RepID=UPI002FF4CC92